MAAQPAAAASQRPGVLHGWQHADQAGGSPADASGGWSGEARECRRQPVVDCLPMCF
ncbi:MAG TPA: hypothetical protein VFA18_02475 [Gemmataceae bacterium]|nr:hypothetical protein [Gemmataceae bacterium]